MQCNLDREYLHNCRLNFPDWLLALAFPFLSHTSTSCFRRLVAQRVVRLFGVGFRTIVTLMPETTLVSLRTLPFFLPLVTSSFSSYNTTQSPFDFSPLLLTQFSHAWRQSFAIEVSDLFSSSPSSSTSANWASMSSDESPCRYISNTVSS